MAINAEGIVKLTRRDRFASGCFSKYSLMFPFTIQGVTIDGTSLWYNTPLNLRTYGHDACLHRITSLQKRYTPSSQLVPTSCASRTHLPEFCLVLQFRSPQNLDCYGFAIPHPPVDFGTCSGYKGFLWQRYRPFIDPIRAREVLTPPRKPRDRGEHF